MGGDRIHYFYNNIVPNTVNDILKKFGGDKLGCIQLGVSDWGVFDVDNNPLKTGFKLRSDAEEVSVIYPVSVVKNEVFDSYPGFDVTPEMRRKVAGGMPLF